MARADALLLVGTLGVVLCAATELQESTTSRNEQKEIKISSKESKDLLDKLRLDLEPAISHGFPFPLALPVPWMENSSSENPKPNEGQIAEEQANVIPSKDSDVSTNANANSESKFEDLVKTANRMMVEEARRRRLFKKKMQTLLKSKLPKSTSKEEVRVSEKPESAEEVEDISEGHGAAMMNDAFRTFRRIAHAMPLMHHVVSTRLSSPFASLPGPFTLRSEDPPVKDEVVDGGGGHAVLMMRGFSLDGSSPVVSSVQRVLKLVPDNSMSIDVSFVPLHSNTRSILRRPLSPLREIEDVPNVGPAVSFPPLPLISRVLNIMSRVRQRFMDDMDIHGNNSSEQNNAHMTKIDPLEKVPSSQEVPSIPSQPASNSTAILKLAKDIQKNDKMLTTVESLSEKTGKRRKRDVQSSSEREASTEDPTATKTRMMTEENPEPQQANSRMLVPEVSAISEQPSPAGLGAVPMGMPFYPSGYVPNMFINNMKMPFWKQFYKVMPYSVAGAPQGLNKLAYQMKMFPKFPMAIGMAGAQQMGMAAPIVEQEYATGKLAATQAAAQTAAAAAADAANMAADASHAAAAVNAAQLTMHPRRVSCKPTCLPMFIRSSRAKRSVRGGGGGAAVQQALDASATSQRKAGGEQKMGRNKAPTNDVSRAKELHKAPKRNTNSPLQQLSSSFFQQTLSNLKTPQTSSERDAPLLGNRGSSESVEDETRNSHRDLVSAGFETYPIQWETQFPVEESDTSIDREVPDTDGRVDTPSSLKELQGMKSVKTRKKVPSRSELWEAAITPDQSAERWTGPVASAFGVVPFFSPLPDSLPGEGAGEELLLGDRAFARPRRSAGADGVAGGAADQEVSPDEAGPAHAGRRNGRGGALRHAKAQSRGSRLHSKLKDGPDRARSAVAGDGQATGKRDKRVQVERMPFLDPTMTEDSRFERYLRRDLGNDFQI